MKKAPVTKNDLAAATNPSGQRSTAAKVYAFTSGLWFF